MSENKGTAATRAKNKYNEANYDNLRIVVPKGRKEIIKAHAEVCGESINGFVNRAIDEAMQRDNAVITDCGGIKPDQPLPPLSYYRGQAGVQPALDENGDIIPG